MMSLSSLLLKSSILRRRIVPYLKSSYFHELDLSIPLAKDLRIPLLENDSYNSFSEIFLDQEYKDFLPTDELSKVVDIGAHYGYFSLWLQNLFHNSELVSIMVEASSLCHRSLNNLCNMDGLKGRFQYLKRAVGDPKHEMMEFFDRPYMASSRFNSHNGEISRKIKILQSKEVFAALPPPYDLIKCDIEGSEWEFLLNYPEIIKNSKYLILEWHSWHTGGGGYSQIADFLKKIDFEILKTSTPSLAVGIDGEVGLLLAKNKSDSS